MDDRPLHLDMSSLCSKWGFGDGDMLDDWWWDTYGEAPSLNSDDLLHALVLTYLAPAIEAAGHRVEIVRVETCHNPVRAISLDGLEVDWYSLEDELSDVSVDVPRPGVEEIARAIVLAPTA